MVNLSAFLVFSLNSIFIFYQDKHSKKWISSSFYSLIETYSSGDGNFGLEVDKLIDFTSLILNINHINNFRLKKDIRFFKISLWIHCISNKIWNQQIISIY